MEKKKAILDKIIDTLQDKKLHWLGKDGEKSRQDFKDGIDYAISSIEQIRLQSEFEEVARELMKFMAERKHPHCSVILTSTDAELVEGLESLHRVFDYIAD